VSKDVVIVQINPMNRDCRADDRARDPEPRQRDQLQPSLVREMNGIATLSRLINRGRLEHEEIQPVNFHLIQAEAEMGHLGASSKFNADWRFPQLPARPRGRDRRSLAGQAFRPDRRALDPRHVQHI